ncbi:MAG: diguanylate cyclase [Sulfuricella denitrificans]|nr:diguanylate cyclase [Sulfuricella denitrificans]
MFSISQENLQEILRQVRQAVYNHEQWHKNITRTIMCRLSCDQQDVAEDSHRCCLFGQWYYGDAPQELRDKVAFVAIETVHRNMHQIASRLLKTMAAGGVILPDDFDTFANALDNLRLQFNTIIRELEELLQNRDPLTGAENRVGMLTTLREMHSMVQRGMQRCCIVIADLDHFKHVNDTYGHQVGDRVLAATVHYLKKNLRPYDRVFRYGGEEFLIFLPNTDPQTGLMAIERMRLGLAEKVLVQGSAAPEFVTASFGMSGLDEGVTVEESIDRADKAMYGAKKAGRNCVRTWPLALED